MIFKKFINFIFSISFKKFRKAKFLFIIDNDQEFYPIDHVEYICLRKIYFFYIFKNIFYFKNLKKNYFISIGRDICFEKVVGNNINILAYKFKLYFPESFYYIYQHSYIYDFEIDNYKKLYKNLKVDKFFVYDKRHKDIFSEFLKTEYILIGSFKNNFINLENIKSKNQYNYISEYRGHSQSINSIECEKYIVKLISNFCKKNNITFFISLNSNRFDKQINKKKEISYFAKLSDHFIFNDKSGFYNSNQSLMNFTMSSNIGVELLSRKINTVYFDILWLSDKKFKNPYLIENSKIFIHQKISYNEFNNKFNYSNNVDFYKNFKRNIPDLIKFDKGNKIFLKELYNK